MNTYEINGISHSLRVEWTPRSHSWIGGNAEAGDRFERQDWYEGVGKIYLPKGESIVFEFSTLTCRDREFGLFVDEFLVINNISKDATLLDLVMIYETFILEILHRIQTYAGGGIIPDIVVPRINGASLVEQGLILEPGHQLTLAFN